MPISGQPELARPLAEAGLRAVVAQGVIDFPAPGVPDAGGQPPGGQGIYATPGETAGSSLILHPLLPLPVLPAAPLPCRGPRPLPGVPELPFFIHLAETRQEVEQSRQQTGLSPVAWLDSLGLLDEKTVAVHAVWLDEADRQVLARPEVKLCHCPESNLKLASGIAPWSTCCNRAGHGPGHRWGGLQQQSRSPGRNEPGGQTAQGGRLSIPTVLPARQVVEMATLGGARVLGLEG